MVKNKNFINTILAFNIKIFGKLLELAFLIFIFSSFYILIKYIKLLF